MLSKRQLREDAKHHQKLIELQRETVKVAHKFIAWRLDPDNKNNSRGWFLTTLAHYFEGFLLQAHCHALHTAARELDRMADALRDSTKHDRSEPSLSIKHHKVDALREAAERIRQLPLPYDPNFLDHDDN